MCVLFCRTCVFVCHRLRQAHIFHVPLPSFPDCFLALSLPGRMGGESGGGDGPCSGSGGCGGGGGGGLVETNGSGK